MQSTYRRKSNIKMCVIVTVLSILVITIAYIISFYLPRIRRGGNNTPPPNSPSILALPAPEKKTQPTQTDQSTQTDQPTQTDQSIQTDQSTIYQSAQEEQVSTQSTPEEKVSTYPITVPIQPDLTRTKDSQATEAITAQAQEEGSVKSCSTVGIETQDEFQDSLENLEYRPNIPPVPMPRSINRVKTPPVPMPTSINRVKTPPVPMPRSINRAKTPPVPMPRSINRAKTPPVPMPRSINNTESTKSTESLLVSNPMPSYAKDTISSAQKNQTIRVDMCEDPVREAQLGKKQREE
ncbi:hypothetical protein NEPAR06_2502, partial [Nematocida parisii]